MLFRSVGLLVLGVWLVGCGDDSHETEADRFGVGAQCSSEQDCDAAGEGETQQTCLNFKGGYCGIDGCQSDDDCPASSACVAHDDGENYCFRTCSDKSECNRHRDAENESNCSSNVDYVDGAHTEKACVPPSG